MLSVLILAVFLASCSGATVANVDGFKITAGDLETAIKIEKEKYDPILLKTEENAKVFRRTILENLIQEAILLSAAKRSGITVSKEELKKQLDLVPEPAMLENRIISSDTWKEKQRRRLIIGKLVKSEVADKIPVTGTDIESYYKDHKGEFFHPIQYHARQIIVDNKEQANQIAAKIKNGEDFGKLAEEFSLSPDRKRGGDLGFFNASTFPPIFAEICQKLKPGETSDVVATDYGFQIFNLLEKRDARQLTLEDARPEIEMRLKEKQIEKDFEEWFKARRESAKITIYEKELEDINV